MIDFWLGVLSAIGSFFVFILWLFASVFLLLDIYEKFEWRQWWSFGVSAFALVILSLTYWGGDLF